MYKLLVSTNQGYGVAKFQAGRTMREANAFYCAFMRSGLYEGYFVTIEKEG